ncbi:hypothetical protein GALMADRAFT_1246600 [Galerina marginata CBS 339.88]|uniref:Uncharacterized protein n=1 Tax=Galerina marginata (strain CBS 339.88) TaxID=685588 RepID=A0A067TIA4_GALM3|nr:hypothetical protein GALMADRAFT_1246600 [Galerina marginata CBS 339.88]
MRERVDFRVEPWMYAGRWLSIGTFMCFINPLSQRQAQNRARYNRRPSPTSCRCSSF